MLVTCWVTCWATCSVTCLVTCFPLFVIDDSWPRDNQQTSNKHTLKSPYQVWYFVAGSLLVVCLSDGWFQSSRHAGGTPDGQIYQKLIQICYGGYHPKWVFAAGVGHHRVGSSMDIGHQPILGFGVHLQVSFRRDFVWGPRAGIISDHPCKM